MDLAGLEMGFKFVIGELTHFSLCFMIRTRNHNEHIPNPQLSLVNEAFT